MSDNPTVSDLLSRLVQTIKANGSQNVRRTLVEAVVAGLIAETDPGISILVIPCGDVLLKATPEGTA